MGYSWFCRCFNWFKSKKDSYADLDDNLDSSGVYEPPQMLPVSYCNSNSCNGICEPSSYQQDDACGPCTSRHFIMEHEDECQRLYGKIGCGVEEVRIFDCNIPIISELFPESVKTINITFSRVKHFTSSVLPKGLVQIDLSYNKLQEIPQCVYDAYISTPNIRVYLKNNDLWFSMYSDLSPSYISPKTINELMKAHRMNLVSTQKVRYAIAVLREKKFVKEAKDLSEKIGEQIKQRVDDGGLTWDNKENVHFMSVQDSVSQAIEKLYQIPTPPSVDTIVDIISDAELRKHVEKDIEEFPEYATLAKKVYDVAKLFGVDMQIIIDELKDGMVDTCLTGKIRRIVSVLNGFVPNIYVGISKNEEIANSIVVVRNRNSQIYGDTEMYVNETIPEVFQILEDACIPLEEQAVWIEYV